ncbi:hypothetical protein [Prauserella muralis]|uniref:hypothetical protein n=1 Tax=Prauserella muralis TaxID=588067 RepID=UPI000DD3FA2D|nr:hypothetical protein [Prauserella muralis]TWE23972.1 hypothetical protein FHX69_5276 [Prauserella muralis]
MGSPSVPRPVLVTGALAALVTVVALGTALVLRPEPGLSAGAEDAPATATSASHTGCGDEPCRVLAQTGVNGMTVELLADGDGGMGRLRAGGPGSGTIAETAITTMGVRLNHDSLRCVETATPVCLVRGPHDGGMVGEVLVWRGDSWRATARPYFSDAGSITLSNVTGDATPEVIVVRHECSRTDTVEECQQAPVLAEVFDLRGGQAGCTLTYGSPGALRNWPEVEVDDSELTTCP